MKCGPDGCPIVAFSDLTPAEQRVQRKRIGETMVAQGFTIEQIAKQLGVGKSTIARDVDGFPTVGKPQRPKGGRPRGKRQVRQRSGPAPEIQQQLAQAVLDEGMTLEQATEAFDLPSVQHAKIAVAKEEGRREAVPLITSADLSMSAQEKLDAAVRQHKRKLDAEFEARVLAECNRRLEELSLPAYVEEMAKIEHSIVSRKGIMTQDTFKLILRCLHPDKSASAEKHNKAFHEFNSLEKRLLSEKESPTAFRPMPKTVAEMMAMRRNKKKKPPVHSGKKSLSGYA